MPLFHNALLSGGTPLKPDISHQHVTSSPKSLRKSKSSAGLLSPLVKLVIHPVASIETALGSIWQPGDQNAGATVELDKEDRRQVLLQRLKDASELKEWRDAAEELDRIEGNNEWKAEPFSTVYDYELIQIRLAELEEARLSRDPTRMLYLLRNSLTRSLGNMGDLNMYKSSHIGTKYLIEKYIHTVCDTFDVFLNCYDKAKPTLDSRRVYEELLRTRQYFGRSALLLSGGGTFGMTHTGVVKTLWENDLLPRIISGSSAGSIVASVLCVKTDEELPTALAEFCNGDLEVFERGDEKNLMRKVVRLLTTKSCFDVQNLIRVMRGWLGDMTFVEAYNRTRRILNISVSSTSMNELPRLLNYITAPHVIIWSAVVASCSVPLVFSPTTIIAKDPKTGDQGPWNPSQLYMDGSVDNDLPMTRLSEMFNVNHFIVSQVNPHVVPFLDDDNITLNANGVQPPDQTAAEASGIWTTLGGIAKSELLHRMHLLTELGVFPTTLTKFRSVMSQKYSGDITILPQISLSMVPRVLQNPDPGFMEQALMSGERATWPKLSRIQNHLAIELAIDETIQKLMRKMAFSPSQVNLRMLSLTSAKHAETDRRREARIFNHTRAKTKSWCAEPNLTHLSQLTPQFQLHPRRELQEKLQSPVVQFVPKRSIERGYSGSDSDEEDNADDGFLLNLSSRARRKRPLESSPEPVAYDSSTSNIRSHSPSPAGSPDPVTSRSQPPVLWPVSGRLGPMSQPVTPFAWRRRRSSPEMGIPSLTMTSSMSEHVPDSMAPVSEAERKYKKLFHRDGNVQSVPVQAGNLPVDISGTRAMLLRRKLSRSDA